MPPGDGGVHLNSTLISHLAFLLAQPEGTPWSHGGFDGQAIGFGTPLALDGAAAHAYFNILHKGLLFMATGAIMMSVGTDRLTELGGLARRMTWLLVLYAVGAASIAGVPLFNGFASKGMVVAGASAEGFYWAEIGLLVASIGTFLSISLKVIWFGFFGRPRDYPDLPPEGRLDRLRQQLSGNVPARSRNA